MTSTVLATGDAVINKTEGVSSLRGAYVSAVKTDWDLYVRKNKTQTVLWGQES